MVNCIYVFIYYWCFRTCQKSVGYGGSYLGVGSWFLVLIHACLFNIQLNYLLWMPHCVCIVKEKNSVRELRALVGFKGVLSCLFDLPAAGGSVRIYCVFCICGILVLSERHAEL